jgi:hypothetical protein
MRFSELWKDGRLWETTFQRKAIKKILVLDMFYDPKIGLLWPDWGFFYFFRFIFMFTNIENKFEMLNK